MSNGVQANEPQLFTHIVCGVDGTPESLVALRQALRLHDAAGSLSIIAAADLAKAAHAGIAATHAAEQLQADAEAALAEARSLAPSANARIVNGDPANVLLREAEQATLVVVGSHGRGRAAGLVLGTVAARMLRDAACSVLLAREPRDVERWPQSIVVGVDGSTTSAAAFAAGRSLADRFGASFAAVASMDDHVDREAAKRIAPELEERPGRAVDALVSAAESADVVVVGTRGLHGLKALGSVSERVAHRAPCSVLVVRPPAR